MSTYDRIISGLLGAQDSYGGALSDDDLKGARQKALMATAAQLLQAGGPSSQPTSFGQALGSGIMAGQQAQSQAGQDALQSMLMRKQLMATKEPKRYVVNGVLVDDAGNKIFEGAPKPPTPTEAENLYSGVERLRAQGVKDDDPRMQALKRQIDILGTRQPAVNVSVGDKLPSPPQGYAYRPDPESPFGYKLEKIPGAPDEKLTEADKKNQVLIQGMEDSERQLNTATGADPTSYVNAGLGLISPAVQTNDNRAYKAAAERWAANYLYLKSGAQAGKDEIAGAVKQFFPQPGEDERIVARKAEARQQEMEAAKNVYGKKTQPTAPKPAAKPADKVVDWSSL